MHVKWHEPRRRKYRVVFFLEFSTICARTHTRTHTSVYFLVYFSHHANELVNGSQFRLEWRQVSRQCSTVEFLFTVEFFTYLFIFLKGWFCISYCLRVVWTKTYCGATFKSCKYDVPRSKSKNVTVKSRPAFTRPLIFIMPVPCFSICMLKDTLQSQILQ